MALVYHVSILNTNKNLCALEAVFTFIIPKTVIVICTCVCVHIVAIFLYHNMLCIYCSFYSTHAIVILL